MTEFNQAQIQRINDGTCPFCSHNLDVYVWSMDNNIYECSACKKYFRINSNEIEEY